VTRIELLQPTLGHSPGELVTIVEETDDELYYYDSFGRWCYVDKSEENESFRYPREDN